MMNNSSVEIMNQGVSCLTEKLGVVDMELFVSTMMRERFDYTKWQRQNFEGIEPDDFHEAAIAYAKTHPFKK